MQNVLPADIAIHQVNGPLIAAIEVKNRERLTADIAAQLRHSMVVHGGVTDVPYFLLVSQDKGFLWAGASMRNPAALPDYEFPMEPVLRRYLPAGWQDRLRPSELEFVVFTWLGEISDLDRNLPASDEPERVLSASGFIRAIHGGTLTWGAAA